MKVKNLWLQVDTAYPLALKERSHVLVFLILIEL